MASPFFAKNSRVRFLGSALLLAAGFALAATTWRVHRLAALPVYGQVPEFSLVDQRGQSVTRSALQGRVWVADFIFTHCAATCPMLTARFSRLQERLNGAPIKLVSFTVDPRRDTPEALARYAEGYRASRGRWLFLTGDKDAIFRLCKEGFKLPVSEESGEPVHSNRFVLVDQQGRIRGYYDGLEEADVQKLRQHISALGG